MATLKPKSLIDPPSEFEVREVWENYLRELERMDSRDPAVKAAKAEAKRVLADK